MQTSLYATAVPPVQNALKALDRLLSQGEAHAQEHSIAQEAFLQARLFPDMFTFTQQVMAVADLSRRGIDRLENKEPSSDTLEPTSFADLRKRVSQALERVGTADKELMEQMIDRTITLNAGGTDLTFTGHTFAVGFLIPNVFFHVSTAYGLLRTNGVPLSKKDFILPFYPIAGRSLATIHISPPANAISFPPTGGDQLNAPLDHPRQRSRHALSDLTLHPSGAF